MKKLFVFFVSAACSIAALAQGGGFQQRTPEERTKSAMEKMAALNLDKDKTAKVDTIFLTYYKAIAKARQDMMSGGGQPDFQAMREKMQPLTEERDKKLKEVLTEAEFKKFKDEIEPALRPRGPGGGGNN
jgi:hypothetical protein